MSIFMLKEMLAHKPKIETLTMRYEDGGRIQVFSFGEKVVRLPGSMCTPEIAKALESA